MGSHSEIAFFPYDLKLWTKYRDLWQEKDFSSKATSEVLITEILGDEKVIIAEDVPSVEEIVAAVVKSNPSKRGPEIVFDAFLSSYAKGRGKSIYGLKTPWNEFYAEEILATFDDAIFLHVMRDPRKSALSAMFVDGGSWFYDPQLHVSRWQRSAQLALRNKVKYGSRYHVVTYEELVKNPRAVVASLLPKLGLSYEEGMEKGDKQPGWQGTNTSFDQPGGSQAARKPELPPDLRHFYERRLRTELAALGYHVAPDSRWVRALWFPVLGLRLLGVFLLHRGIHVKSVVGKMLKR